MKRTSRYLLVLLVILSLVATACNSGTGSPASDSPAPDTEAPAVEPEAPADEDSQDNPEPAASGDAVEVEYFFWGNQTEVDTIMGTIDTFNSAQQDVVVKGMGIDSSVYFQKLNAYIASNTLPDIIQVAVDYGDIYNAKQVFEPLDSLVDDNGMKPLIPDNLWDGLSYGGAIYAVPIQGSAPLLVANKTLFDAAGIAIPEDGWTEDDFRDIAIQLTNPDERQYGVIYAGSIKSWPRDLYASPATKVYDWDAKTMNAAGNDAYKHIYELLVLDLMHEHNAAPAVLSSQDIGGGFETGKYGMAMIGFWDIAEIHKVVQDSFEWQLIPFPTNETYGKWRTEVYANALSLSANSEKKEEAFRYLHWIATDEYAQANSVFLPVNSQVAESQEFLTTFPEGSKVFDKELALDAFYNGVAWRNTGAVAEINENVIGPEIERLILKPDDATLDEIMDTIQEQGQKLFDTYTE